MVNFLVRSARWLILVALLVVVLLGVGTYLQNRETPPGKVAPVQPTTGATSTVPGVTTTTVPTAVPPSEEGRDAKVAPSGYAQSCASAFPWGQRVPRPFVCVQAPRAGDPVAPGFVMRGYAGGAFENTLVATIVAEMANGTRVPPTNAIRVPITYTAPDVGMPGVWQLSVNLGGLPEGEGKLHVEVFAESPQDGTRIVEAKFDARLQR